MASTKDRQNQRKPQEMDRLRAKALKGDPLKHLADADREWIWRSLLKKVRWEQTLAIAGLTDEQAQSRLMTVRRWYQQRIDAYKRDKATAAMQPKVVRPIAPAKVKTPQRRGRGLFGVFGK